MIKNPKVSVVIPVYNRENEIGFTIDSVINQTFQDWELIIVDNKSTDNTVSIIRSYRDPRIKLIINEENIGLYPNWNEGYKYVKGEFYKHLSSDNLIAPEFLEVCLELFTEHNGLDIVATSMGNIDANGTRISVSRKFDDSIKTGSFVLEKIRTYGDDWLGSPDNQLIKVDFLKKLFKESLYDSNLRFSADFNFTLDCLLSGNLSIGLVGRELAYLRRHDGSLTSSEGNARGRFVEYRYYKDKLALSNISYQRPSMLTGLSLFNSNIKGAFKYFSLRRKELRPDLLIDVRLLFIFLYEVLKSKLEKSSYVYFR